MNFSRLLSLALISCSITSCTLDAPVGEDYYAGTEKIAGGKPPSTPVATFSSATRVLTFTAAIDPETSAEVPTYYVYAYSSEPTAYYKSRDIVKTIKTPEARSYAFPDVKGNFILVVTGYDGYRESAISNLNKITFTLN